MSADPAQSVTDDDAVLNVPQEVVVFRGDRLTLTPLTLGQIGPFITAARALIGRVGVAITYAKAGAEVETGALLLDLLEQDGEALSKALAVATGQDAGWIAGGTLDEVAGLVSEVVRLNKDFFAQRLPNLLLQARQALPDPPNPAGPTSSNASSAPDTATPSS